MKNFKETTAPKLSGLKVVGKIELPTVSTTKKAGTKKVRRVKGPRQYTKEETERYISRCRTEGRAILKSLINARTPENGDYPERETNNGRLYFELYEGNGWEINEDMITQRLKVYRRGLPIAWVKTTINRHAIPTGDRRRHNLYSKFDYFVNSVEVGPITTTKFANK